MADETDGMIGKRPPNPQIDLTLGGEKKVEQVVELQSSQVAELSLEELAQVGGGAILTLE